MSALGQKQTCAMQNAMSALPPKRTCSATRDVRFVPKADIISFDHFVGPSEERRRHCDAECLSGLEIDNKFVFARRLHRQIGRLLALENPIDIAGRLTELAHQIGAIRHKAPASDMKAIEMDGGQLMPRC